MNEESTSQVIPRCPVCRGTGCAACPECGHTVNCRACEGTGWDSDVIDLARWLPAERDFQHTHQVTYDWIFDGQVVGRCTLDQKTTLDARQFMWPNQGGEK